MPSSDLQGPCTHGAQTYMKTKHSCTLSEISKELCFSKGEKTPSKTGEGVDIWGKLLRTEFKAKSLKEHRSSHQGFIPCQTQYYMTSPGVHQWKRNRAPQASRPAGPDEPGEHGWGGVTVPHFNSDGEMSSSGDRQLGAVIVKTNV